MAIDLADPEAPARLLAETAGDDIGLLASNAGFGAKGAHAEADPAVLTGMLMVDAHAPLQLTRGFAGRLRARGRGGILLTASVEGLIGGPYSAGYAATKALVVSLAEAPWAELRPAGVDVLGPCPGATDAEAAARAGVDAAKLANAMPAADVAAFALDALPEGPTAVPSAHYRALFDRLLASPRRAALVAMADGVRAALA